MKVMGGHTLDENYVIKLNQHNNENDLMAEATCNDIAVNGTVRDHDGSDRGPDRRMFKISQKMSLSIKSNENNEEALMKEDG